MNAQKFCFNHRRFVPRFQESCLLVSAPLAVLRVAIPLEHTWGDAKSARYLGPPGWDGVVLAWSPIRVEADLDGDPHPGLRGIRLLGRTGNGPHRLSIPPSILRQPADAVRADRALRGADDVLVAGAMVS